MVQGCPPVLVGVINILTLFQQLLDQGCVPLGGGYHEGRCPDRTVGADFLHLGHQLVGKLSAQLAELAQNRFGRAGRGPVLLQVLHSGGAVCGRGVVEGGVPLFVCRVNGNTLGQQEFQTIHLPEECGLAEAHKVGAERICTVSQQQLHTAIVLA